VKARDGLYFKDLGWMCVEYVFLGMLPLWMVISVAFFLDAGELLAERLRDGTLISFAVVVLIVECRKHAFPPKDSIDKILFVAVGLLALAFVAYYANLSLYDGLVVNHAPTGGLHVSSDQRRDFSLIAVGIALLHAVVATVRDSYRKERKLRRNRGR
jgi:hypothetical protein